MGANPTVGTNINMSLRSDKKLMREYKRNWIALRRKSYFKDKSCVKCGSKERLELDHINPETKIDHKIWSWKESRRIEELAKCQILCYNCHKEKTTLEKINRQTIPENKWIHGTRNTYLNHKCRCELCKNNNKEWRRKFYLRTGN